MYEGIDEELASGYDPKKVAANARTASVPTVEVNFEAELLGVTKEKGAKAGKFYQFRFKISKSNNELVPVDAVYKESFYPGNGSEVDTGMFWDKITPLLMAIYGETQVLSFPAVDRLGELLKLTKAAPDGLGLKFACSQTTEPARPKKDTGEIDPKHKNPDGTPKHFKRAVYRPASAA